MLAPRLRHSPDIVPRIHSIASLSIHFCLACCRNRRQGWPWPPGGLPQHGQRASHLSLYIYMKRRKNEKRDRKSANHTSDIRLRTESSFNKNKLAHPWPEALYVARRRCSVTAPHLNSSCQAFQKSFIRKSYRKCKPYKPYWEFAL